MKQPVKLNDRECDYIRKATEQPQVAISADANWMRQGPKRTVKRIDATLDALQRARTELVLSGPVEFDVERYNRALWKVVTYLKY